MGDVSVAAGVAALTVIGLCAWTLHGSGPADAAARASGLSVFGTIHPKLLGYGNDSLQEDVPPARVRLASLESDAPVTTGSVASFSDRFALDRPAPPSWSRRASFDDRFGGTSASGSIAVKTVSIAPSSIAATATLESPAPSATATDRVARLAAASPARAETRSAVPTPRPAPRYRLASLSPDTPLPAAYAPAGASKDSGITNLLNKMSLREQPSEPAEKDAPKEANPLTDDPAHTAVYDISARTVYMPNGERLEAHSGLGDYMDDVRAVKLRKLGPTPPNVYDLRMREAPFHGVQAIRLIPVDGGKMYGRDGILAHPFMLRANGESNGCVSFKDYPAFLKAYQRGEVTRMVVVEQLDEPPGGRTAGDWFRRIFFGRS